MAYGTAEGEKQGHGSCRDPMDYVPVVTVPVSMLERVLRGPSERRKVINSYFPQMYPAPEAPLIL